MIKDRHSNPIDGVNELYADWDIIKRYRNAPFPLNYTHGMCKVVKLDVKKTLFRSAI